MGAENPDSNSKDSSVEDDLSVLWVENFTVGDKTGQSSYLKQVFWGLPINGAVIILNKFEF